MAAISFLTTESTRENRRDALEHCGAIAAAKPWRPLVEACRRHAGRNANVVKIALYALQNISTAVGGDALITCEKQAPSFCST